MHTKKIKPDAANRRQERRRIRCALFSLVQLMAVFWAPVLAAEEATVTAILDPRKITLGEQASLTIEVSGSSRAGLPSRIAAPDLAIGYMGYNSSVQIINGERSLKTSYVYTVGASRAGRFTIPPIEVQVEGKGYMTEPQELIVTSASDRHQDLSAGEMADQGAAFLRLRVPKEEIYVGEVIPLELTLYVRGSNNISGIGQPEMERENLVMKRFPPKPRQSVTEIQGRLYSTLTLDTSLFAISEGKVVIGPCKLSCTYFDEQSNARMPTFFRRSTRRDLASNAIELDVKPLPPGGKPAGFSGAVGNFSMETSASPTKLKIRDPISVDLSISGVGNFDSLDPPAMKDTSGWQLYPSRELSQQLSDGVTSGKVTFSQVIIPQEQHAEIPPFEFSFFDPEKGEYVVLASDAVPIEVLPDTTPETPPVIVDAPGASMRQGFPPPEELLEDVLQISTATPDFRSRGTPILQSPAFWAAQAVPALALLGIAGIGARRRWMRWAAARAAAMGPRTYQSIRAEIESAGQIPRHDFYHAVLECLDTWKTQRDGAPGDALPEEMQSGIGALESSAQIFLYGSDHSHETEPVSASERKDVVKLLRRL